MNLFIGAVLFVALLTTVFYGDEVERFLFGTGSGESRVATQERPAELPINCPDLGKSGPSRVAVETWLINDCARDLEVMWVDYSGQLKSFGVLAPRHRLSLSTYEGHPWLFVDATLNECLGTWMPDSEIDQGKLMRLCNRW